MALNDEVRSNLLALAHELGDARQMSILGEGNVSASLGRQHFLVKASGTQLGSLRSEELVEVDSRPLLEALAVHDELSDSDIEALLLDSRKNERALKPSVETVFHAWLLQQPNVIFVGHVHAIAVNQVLASPRKREFAERRVIPDQVVYCGAESVLVPYVDPGFVLARRIQDEVEAFRGRTGALPKTILLESHGIIAVGTHPSEVAAALAMAEKAARIFVGAAGLGGPIFMDDTEVHRIAGRSDEHYRQRMLLEHKTGPDLK